jgi:hypothetical protein
MKVLAHMGVIEIPEAVIPVKAHQEPAVPHRNVPGHDVLLVSSEG